MSIRRFVPDFVVDAIKLARVRRRFPGRAIWTHQVGREVELGLPCALCRGVEIGPGVSVGDYSYVNGGTVVGSGRIGRFCSIGYSCQIGMPEHPTDHLSTSPHTYAPWNLFGMPATWDISLAPPLIGHDVWVGSHAFIRQGVTIGNGAVIAAGSVVTRDVIPYAIVGGVPARLIRMRFPEEEIAFLQRLQWWALPLPELKKLRHLFAAGPDWRRQIASDLGLVAPQQP